MNKKTDNLSTKLAVDSSDGLWYTKGKDNIFTVINNCCIERTGLKKKVYSLKFGSKEHQELAQLELINDKYVNLNEVFIKSVDGMFRRFASNQNKTSKGITGVIS